MKTRLRVATYNLYLGADLALLFDASGPDGLAAQVEVVRAQLAATRFEERADALARVLARERPDLLGLQEVARWTTSPDGTAAGERVLVDFLPTLLDALERAGCGYAAHVAVQSFAGALPVADGGWTGVAGANVTLVRRGAPVEVVAGHTGTFEHVHRVATGLDGVGFPVVRGWGSLDVLVEGRPLRFVNTHTEAYDAGARDAQRDELIARTGDTDAPVVLVGDLNTTPDLVGMPAPWRDAWAAGEGDGATFGQAADLANGTSTMRERIDYVWVRGVTVRGCRVVGDQPGDRTTPHRLWPSDHAAVVADLEV